MKTKQESCVFFKSNSLVVFPLFVRKTIVHSVTVQFYYFPSTGVPVPGALKVANGSALRNENSPQPDSRGIDLAQGTLGNRFLIRLEALDIGDRVNYISHVSVRGRGSMLLSTQSVLRQRQMCPVNDKQPRYSRVALRIQGSA